jgi:phosphoglycerate kinase
MNILWRDRYMKFGMNTLDEVDVKGRTVLLRLDLNEPVDKKVNKLKDITRIRAAVPTLKELSGKGSKVVIMAHQGSDIEYKNFYTTRPHARELTKLLGKEVMHIKDICGPSAIETIINMKEGEILLLDNVRFLAEEQTLFELNLKLTHEEQAKTLMVRRLASLADLYVCDAFAAAHRDQPSICGFEQVLPSYMGRLFEREYGIIEEIMENPKRDCVFILGGAKIADAFAMMNSVLKSGAADYVLTGGLAANILLESKGIRIGKVSLDFIKTHKYEQFIEEGARILSKFGNKVVLPLDLAYVNEGRRTEVNIKECPDVYEIIDIGKETVNKYKSIISSAKTVFANGPMGIFEEAASEFGTKEIWKAMSETDGFTVIGGGDSITAANQYHITEKMNYICTGGGALIRFLTGEELPAVKALRYAAQNNNNRVSQRQNGSLKQL